MRILAKVTGFDVRDWRRMVSRGAGEARSSVWGMFTEMPVKHPKEMFPFCIQHF